MANTNLTAAKSAKNDEFYTRYIDIENEVRAYVKYNPDVFRGKTILCPCDDPEWSNFTKYFAKRFDAYGLKKLISTSYAYDSKNPKPNFDWQPTLFEAQNPNYDAVKSPRNGKIFTLTENEEPPRDVDKLQWRYLEGDGDFRSKEVTELLQEADIVVTNPPFSLFREFIDWIFKANKQLLVIGSVNVITYREIFPLIQSNKLWLGKGFSNGNAYFKAIKNDSKEYADGVFDEETGLVKFRNVCWFTNIDHGKRHEPISMVTMAERVECSKHKEIRENGYLHYDNYDAIDVPYSDAIPSDYEGVMGVPITFLDRYCPEQFEIVGITKTWNGLATKKYPDQIQIDSYQRKKKVSKLNDGAVIELDNEPNGETYYMVDGKIYRQVYARILIKRK